MDSSGGRREEGALASYLNAIRTFPLVVLGIALLTFGVAAALLARKADTFVANAEILVTPLAGDASAFAGLPLLRESNDPTRVTQTAAELLDSTQAAKTAAASIRAGYTREKVQAAIEVEPRGQSNIVAVTAEASDSRTSARLANTFARSALELRRVALRRQVAARIQALDVGTLPEESAQLRQLQQISQEGDPTLSLSQNALAPTDPVGSPNWLILLLAGLAGTAIGCGAAVLLQLSDRSLRDPAEVLDAYPLPVLAQVPRDARRWFRRRGPGLAVSSAAIEAYRSLQVQLRQSSADNRVVAFLSASNGDGKTTSSIQFALTLAASGNRVILIDLDLRRPQIAKTFALPGSAELSTALGSHRPLEEVLVSFPQYPRLQVAPFGDPGGSVDLMTEVDERLSGIIAEARRLADYVVLDTAPLGEVSDALRVVPYADAVILVARLGNTQRSGLERVRDLLDRASVRPFGLLLVGVGDGRGAAQAYGYQASNGSARRWGSAVRGVQRLNR